MQLPRFAPAVLIALFLAGCSPGGDDNPDGDVPATEAPADDAAQGTDSTSPPPGEGVGADAFIAGLALPFPHEVTNHREIPQKDGGTSHVYSIDFAEGTVETIDRQLADALLAAGFERGALKAVPGGLRIAYSAPDGRRVSTMIRNKKYFGDRIPEGSAGQVSLSYVPR